MEDSSGYKKLNHIYSCSGVKQLYKDGWDTRVFPVNNFVSD